MLYLHCGWMKTGTTSLRGALARQQALLEDAGLVYAQQWRTLTKSLKEPEPDVAIDEFRLFLESHRGEDVLCSNEVLTWAIWDDGAREAFCRLLSAAETVMPVSCIWTLRRADEAADSMYRWLLLRREMPSPADFATNASDRLARSFSGLRKLEQGSTVTFVYVKYDRRGAHNGRLLRSFGLTEETAAAVERELEGAPRLNSGLSHKQLVALCDPAALSAKAGVRLDRPVLRDAFEREAFRFEDDRPGAVFDDRAREGLHRRALAAAAASGLDAYSGFFEDTEIGKIAPNADLSLSALTDDDLSRLVEHLQHPATQ